MPTESTGEDGRISRIEGIPNDGGMGTSICAKVPLAVSAIGVPGIGILPGSILNWTARSLIRFNRIS